MGQAAEEQQEASSAQSVGEVLDELMWQSGEALFDAYELLATRDGSTVADLGFALYVSSIGFSSEDFCGSVMLAMPKAVVSETQPIPDESGRTDWASELANQMAGRLKNCLLRYGVTITISLPVVVLGDHLQWAAVHPTMTRIYRLKTAQGPIALRLDAEVPPGLMLVEEDAANDDGMDEGDFQMF